MHIFSDRTFLGLLRIETDLSSLFIHSTFAPEAS